jgi:hypothetical protein
MHGTEMVCPPHEKCKTNTFIMPEEYYMVLIVTLSRGATMVNNHLFMGGEVLDWIQGVLPHEGE